MKNLCSSLKMLMCTLLLGLSSFTVSADSSDGPLKSNMEVYSLNVNGEGKEEVKPADTVEPGGILEYKMMYTNQGNSELQGLVVTAPIPQSTTFLGGSQLTQVDSTFLASLDGELFEPEPIKRMRVNAQGEMEEVTVSPNEYRMIRWVPKREIDASESMVFKYRVRVN